MMAANLKSMRLLTGQSTENVDKKNTYTGKMDHNQNHTIKGPIDMCLEKMASGEISPEIGQAALSQLALTFQRIQAIGGKQMN